MHIYEVIIRLCVTLLTLRSLLLGFCNVQFSAPVQNKHGKLQSVKGGKQKQQRARSNMRASGEGSPGIRRWICMFTWELQFWISSLEIICHRK